jgi:hypothetical protein
MLQQLYAAMVEEDASKGREACWEDD